MRGSPAEQKQRRFFRVLKVLVDREDGKIAEREIERLIGSDGLNPETVRKTVNQMIDYDWLERVEENPASYLQITAEGRHQLALYLQQGIR